MEPSASAHPASPWSLPADALARHLIAGGAALFPTDTLPALAACPPQADLIWRLKQRPLDKPLILMGADLEQLRAALTVAWSEPWLEMAEQSWPGAVTLVLPIRGAITQALHPGGHSLGLRVPACEAARALLRASGPLATTSVNRSGEPAALDAVTAAAMFPSLPLLEPLPWVSGLGQASRVLAWEAAGAGASGGWRELRRGPAGSPTTATEER